MPIDVFDNLNNLHHFQTWEVFSICKDVNSRRHIARVGNDEYYFPHTIEQRRIMTEPSGFYQINQNQIVNTTLIDKYKNGKITIGGRDYYLSDRRIRGFESFYFPY
ncbi:LytTR family transcriptional regulator DNA-binding domain-containing protein [Paenibacillus harenae]|uniref:LytTR family transcriptional regulator DNA-binding domain-containing protein n=1 Tax=Paenibacillus harenae TaxID=306543 RepID=UPI000490E9AC